MPLVVGQGRVDEYSASGPDDLASRHRAEDGSLGEAACEKFGRAEHATDRDDRPSPVIPCDTRVTRAEALNGCERKTVDNPWSAGAVEEALAAGMSERNAGRSSDQETRTAADGA